MNEEDNMLCLCSSCFCLPSEEKPKERVVFIDKSVNIKDSIIYKSSIDTDKP